MKGLVLLSFGALPIQACDSVFALPRGRPVPVGASVGVGGIQC